MDSRPVLLAAIIFSDSASRDHATGKLTLAGIFERLTAPQMPFTTPAFLATVLVTNMRGKIENLPMTMEIQDGKENVIVSSIGKITASSDIDRTDIVEITFPFLPTEFISAGRYEAVVFFAGEPLGKRGLDVVLGQYSG
jgi:hypothetical protein